MSTFVGVVDGDADGNVDDRIAGDVPGGDVNCDVGWRRLILVEDGVD